MITANHNEENIKQSLFYYLNHTIYSGTGLGTTFNGKVLKQHYSDPQLSIIDGYPDSLQNLQLPTLAIAVNPTTATRDLAYNRQIMETTYSFSIYGFCGGMQSDPLNKLQRDRMKNDVRYLLEDAEYINLYEYPNFTTIKDDFAVVNISARDIPETGPLSAERYRFVIDFEVDFIKDDYHND